MENHRISQDTLLELQPKIDQWKENGEIVMVSLSQDPFDGIFRVPTMDDLKLANAAKNDMDKNRQLVISCVLHPNIEVFSQIIEKRSGIITPIATQLVEAAGVTQEATVKKL